MQWLDFCRNSHDNVGFNGDMLKCVALGLCLGLSAAVAQGPIVLQRGVLNAVTLEPAPSRVAPGDLLLLRGLNLAPADQVLIATKSAQILSVAPGQIRVQVPFDARSVWST